MLKFFRKYNKWLLAVGGTLLMIAFLLPMSTFSPQQGDVEIGEVDGRKVMFSERARAASELDLLRNFGLPLAMLPLDQRDAPTQYLLMQLEAEAMGVSASVAEVDQVLLDLRVGTREMGQLLQATRATEGMVRETLRRWIAVQNYLPLVQGRAYTPLQQRMGTFAFVSQIMQQNPMQAMQFLPLTQGSQRLSEPLVAHFIANQSATIGGEVVLVGHEKYLDRVPEPTDAQLTALFHEHREALPGEGQPFGFGYRTPARVKIEWLQVPADAAGAKVAIDEADAIDFFEQNKPRYADPTAGAAEPTYAEVRGRVMSDLRQRKTEELAAQTAKAAQTALQEDSAVRRLTRSGGYFDVPADFQPLSLDDVSARVEQRTGVRPVVGSSGDAWIPTVALTSLPGLGMTQLAGRPGVGLVDYVSSARELGAASDNPLVPLRLQRGLPSEPLRGFDGSYFVFRIVDAQPSKAPETLDAVRAEVTEDWRSVQAYELLKAELPAMVQSAKERGLQAGTSELGAPMLSVGPVARREQSMMGMGMGLETPSLPGIGQSDALLDAMFATAAAATEGEHSPIGSLESLPEAERIGGSPVEERQSVAIYRVDAFQPAPQSELESAVASPFVGSAIDSVMLEGTLDENPFAVKAIAKRIGYTGEGLDDEAETDTDAAAAESVANAG